MTFKIGVCDDELRAIESFHSHLKKLEISYDIDFEISYYSSPKELLTQYTTSGMFHIIFLDIEMPGMNGLDLAHHIRNNIDKQVKIVFVSNYPQYMQDSFPTNPYHYLTKPLQENDLAAIIARLQKDYTDSHVYKLILQIDGTEEFVNIQDIYYIENKKGFKQQLVFVLKNRQITCHGNLKDWEKELESYHFVSPYRGILVNLEHIHFINNGMITLNNKTSLPISRRQEPILKSLFARRIYAIHRE
jgi:DNA-binding LytR/AlgR family response regulator